MYININISKIKTITIFS